MVQAWGAYRLGGNAEHTLTGGCPNCGDPTEGPPDQDPPPNQTLGQAWGGYQLTHAARQVLKGGVGNIIQGGTIRRDADGNPIVGAAGNYQPCC